AAEALGDRLGALHRKVPTLAPTDALLQRFADDIISTRHGLLAGQLQAVMGLDRLTPDTMLAPRPNLMVAWEPDTEAETITAHVHGKG
ncbi:hypothetical protein, partial [Tritonibacter sp. SIMBA_163]|uniref:hypothetical protein n=1 Tax=Tritonibacter sp. SIMBA_163 TaxID=3080868 RepID=UPI00397EF2E2